MEYSDILVEQVEAVYVMEWHTVLTEMMIGLGHMEIVIFSILIGVQMLQLAPTGYKVHSHKEIIV